MGWICHILYIKSVTSINKYNLCVLQEWEMEGGLCLKTVLDQVKLTVTRYKSLVHTEYVLSLRTSQDTFKGGAFRLWHLTMATYGHFSQDLFLCHVWTRPKISITFDVDQKNVKRNMSQTEAPEKRPDTHMHIWVELLTSGLEDGAELVKQYKNHMHSERLMHQRILKCPLALTLLFSYRKSESWSFHVP